jgi:hypothetical protein
MAGLALDAHGGHARHVDPVAPPGLAPVLAVEISTRPAANSCRLATFVRTHAHAVLACDFFITVTAR